MKFPVTFDDEISREHRLFIEQTLGKNVFNSAYSERLTRLEHVISGSTNSISHPLVPQYLLSHDDCYKQVCQIREEEMAALHNRGGYPLHYMYVTGSSQGRKWLNRNLDVTYFDNHDVHELYIDRSSRDPQALEVCSKDMQFFCDLPRVNPKTFRTSFPKIIGVRVNEQLYREKNVVNQFSLVCPIFDDDFSAYLQKKGIHVSAYITRKGYHFKPVKS